MALAVGLALHDVLQIDSAGMSLVCTLPALAGMWLGQNVRWRISPAAFPLVYFGSLLALGAKLAFRGVA